MSALSADQSHVQGSPFTTFFIDRDGIIRLCENGTLLADLGLFWKREIVGNSIHDVLAPHFTGEFTKDNHIQVFNAYMECPVPRKIGDRKPFILKGRDGKTIRVMVTLSGPREVLIPTTPGMPVCESVEGVTAWVLPWDTDDE